MGQISVNDEIVASVTEDVSHNGSISVWDSTISSSDMRELKEPFPEAQEMTVFDTDELKRTLVFEVDGVARWLDFTPLPIDPSFMSNEAYIEQFQKIYQHEDELTWEIGAMRELGITNSYRG